MAFRSLAKTPGLTAIALVSLALGIGANSAIFSVLNVLLLRPLPVPAPERIVYLSTAVPGEPDHDQAFSWSMFQDLKRQRELFSDVFSWNGGTMSNFEVNGTRYRAAIAQASGNYFHAIGIQPFIGRFISESDTGKGAGQSQPVAVLNYRSWRTWFHADPHVIGQKIYVEGKPFNVIGVQPDAFSGLVIDGVSDVTIPIFSPGLMQPAHDNKHLWFTLFARLQPSVSVSQAHTRLGGIWPRILEAESPADYTGARLRRFLSRRVHIDSAAIGVSFLRTRFSRPLRLLQIAAAFILAIACLNLGNLFLAKAVSHRRQTAIQKALGATVWEVIRPHLIESLMLSGLGALMGIAIARPAAALMIRTAWTGFVSTPLNASVDMRVLEFSALAAVVTAILFGVAPALYAARTQSLDALRESQGTRRGASNTRRLLLVTQLAMSVVLLTGAVLFVQTVHSLETHDAGFKRDHFLTFVLFPSPSGAGFPEDLNPYYQHLAESVHNLPGVESVSYSQMGPANEFEAFSPVYRRETGTTADVVDETVAPGFFGVAGMHLLAGREFQWSDLSHKDRPVAIISKSLATHLFGHDDPIGKTIALGSISAKNNVTIIGVVNSAALWKVESSAPLAIYSLFGQRFQEYEPILDVRTAAQPAVMKRAIERVIHGLGRHESLRSMTVEERLDSYITVQRITAAIAASFGVLAILIAVAGVYGLAAYNVTARTGELGIRSALGAQRRHLVSVALRESMLLGVVGCSCGLLATLVCTKWIRSLVFGVSPNSPMILTAVLIGLFVAILLAALRPAWKAARIDPLAALRVE
ncbi:MAG: ADOP family duplicated permease [Acidobacteriota bacterium]|nr:ADOP family duplicated permease [Acidobacteriota bacterium]